MMRIGIVGAGTMGIGVSQVFATAGHRVQLVDVSTRALERARAEIAEHVRLIPLTGAPVPAVDPHDIVANITFTTQLKDLRDVDYVIENITENWDLKRILYQELTEVCRPDVPFGANTSAIPITRIASATDRPASVVGTHFMNPAPLKPTVEIIRGYHTSEETLTRTTALLDGVGKRHVIVADSPGFVTNRVMMLMVNEAVFLLHERVATAAEVDRLFKECFGHSMGPLETADLIGLDTVLLSLEVLYENFNDPKYRPCPLLRTLVDAGRCGMKSGQGFHSYGP